MKRIVLQNQLQTQQEDQIEIEEIDGAVQESFDEKLQSSLQELRDTYEQQMAENRAGFSAVYDKKIQDLQSSPRLVLACPPVRMLAA